MHRKGLLVAAVVCIAGSTGAVVAEQTSWFAGACVTIIVATVLAIVVELMRGA